MEPIRGPLDYHRYPPSRQHRTTSPKPASKSHNMPNQPFDNSAARNPLTQSEAPPTPSPFASPTAQRVPQRVAMRPATVMPPPDEHDLDETDEVAGQRRKARHRGRAAHSAHAAEATARHRIPPHSAARPTPPLSGTDDAVEASTPAPHRIRRKRRVNLFFSRGHRKRLAAHSTAPDTQGALPLDQHPAPPRRPRWLWARRGATVLLGIGCLELLFAALTSPRMAVHEVDIRGLVMTPAAAVEPVQRKLMGQNWIRARVREAARALTQLPTVRSAQVVRVLSWPPRLDAQVEERQPFARVGAGGAWWVVDEAGMPFRHATAADKNLYAVTAPTLQPIYGHPLPPAAWRTVVDFAAALSGETQHGHDWTLRRIYFDKQGFASLRVAGGANDQILVRLGNNRWAEKLARARATLAFFEQTGRHAVALNLISYSRPTWTPRVVLAGVPDSATHAGSESANLTPTPGDAVPQTASDNPAGDTGRVAEDGAHHA